MRAGTYEFKTDFIGLPYREGHTEGLAEGRSADVLTILDTRGIPVTDDARTRITTCTDPDLLATWVRRAITVTHADELFD